MSKRDDESLASTEPTDPKRRTDDSIQDVTPDEHDPATFDIGAMVAGVRATRMRVKISPNGHLLADLQELAEEIDSYATDEDVPDDLVDEWVELKAEFDTEYVYVIEGRNSDWVKAFESEAKAQGINPKRKGLGDQEVREHIKRLMQAQIAAQIVSPEGVTEQDIAALFAASEPEGDKLWRAMKQVNEQPARTVTPDFSARVSRLSRRG